MQTARAPIHLAFVNITKTPCGHPTGSRPTCLPSSTATVLVCSQPLRRANVVCLDTRHESPRLWVLRWLAEHEKRCKHVSVACRASDNLAAPSQQTASSVAASVLAYDRRLGTSSERLDIACPQITNSSILSNCSTRTKDLSHAITTISYMRLTARGNDTHGCQSNLLPTACWFLHTKFAVTTVLQASWW